MTTNSTGTKSLRDDLKIFTQSFHDALESTTLAKELSSGSIDKNRYIAYLQSLHAIHKNLENSFKNMSEWQLYNIDANKRCRLHLLEKDLEILGSSPKNDAAKLNLNLELSFSSAVGILYVLEGSTMGGKLLAQRLEHMCGDNGVKATCYFEAYKGETLDLWREYCEFLLSYERQNPQESSRVILSACGIFLQLLEVMRELG